MRQRIVIAILSVVITGCRSMNNTSVSVESLSPEEVNIQIASLREFIIPPKGANKSEIDTIFGTPDEIIEFGFMDSPAYYPMHKYQLLAPKQGQEFRAYLYVTYEDDKVEYIGISHYCVFGGLPYGAAADERWRKVLIANDICTLKDLIEIKKKYENKLKDASWNE